MVAWGGMCGCSGGACVVAPQGGAWLLAGGACMVAPGGCAWLLRGGGGACMVKGGMRGEGGVCVVKGGMCGKRGVCMAKGGLCLVKGGMHGMHPPTPEIQPVIARAVHILLECILVTMNVQTNVCACVMAYLHSQIWYLILILITTPFL